MSAMLLMAALVMLAGVLLNRISGKLGIPVLLGFILLGMLLGSDGIGAIPFENYDFAEDICSVALIFIMFYGGFGTSWKEARPVIAPAALLSTLGVVLTAGLTGLFCHFALGMGWIESFLFGAVVGSTDAASVFSILRSRKLNLKDHTASLLEVESGSNDPCAYMLTAIFISAAKGTVGAGGIIKMVLEQLLYGLGVGALLAVCAVWLIKRIHFFTSGFEDIFTVAIALLAYAAPTVLGGNGYLSAYIVGLVLGNADIRHKKTLVPFFDGLTGIMQMLLFFLLGLLSTPSQLPQVMLPALAIALFLTLVARPIAVAVLMTPFRSRLPQQLTVAWAGLRGAASIVFAVMAVTNAAADSTLFHTVFCVVLFSVLVQGSLLPKVAGSLRMVDADGDVRKTFTDYSEEIPVRFVQFTIPDNHPWCGCRIKELVLPPETLLVTLQRGEKTITPTGKTEIHAQDVLILAAGAPEKDNELDLFERVIEKEDELIGKKLEELSETALIMLIRRGDRVIIPRGRTVIRENDVLVMGRKND